MPGTLRSLLVVTSLLVTGAVLAPAPASADPTAPDGSPSSLQAQLAQASQAYNDAKGRLDAAKQRQADLTTQAAKTRDELDALGPQAVAIAVAAYKGGQLSQISALLSSGTPDDLLARATTLQIQVDHDDRTLRDLAQAQATYTEQLAGIDTEIQTEATQLAIMDKRKGDLEKALGNGGSAGPAPGKASATPAPRNPDGTWPKESCSLKDPTTSGCLTPRTLHAYQEARKAGYTRYTACFRNESSGEHPLGRACDFSANATGFQNVAASGGDKAYGDSLASWFLANADRLAVLYVIWYQRIWLPATGWKAYRGDGTVAGNHLNHVHLSVQ